MLFLAPLGACGDDEGTGQDAAVEDSAKDGTVSCQPPDRIIIEGRPNTQRLDVGWTGAAFSGVGSSGGSRLALEVTECSEECGGTCRVRGPIKDPALGEVFHNKRCIADPSQVCETNSDCDGIVKSPLNPFDHTGICRYVWGGVGRQEPVGSIVFWLDPDPSTSPTIDKEIEPDPVAGEEDSYHWPLDGVYDTTTGDITLENDWTSVLINPLSDPGTCNGDANPGDGQRDGTCSGGTNNGKACDVHSVSEFGNQSMDCGSRPFILPIRVKVSGLSSVGGVQRTLSAQSLRCPLPGTESLPCWCGVCTGDRTRVCSSDSDCSQGSSCGFATAPSEGGFEEGDVLPYGPSLCDPTPLSASPPQDPCDWNESTATGTCDVNVEFDSEDIEDVVPGRSGKQIYCLPTLEGSRIVLSGGARKINSTQAEASVGALFCVPPTLSPGVDELAGYPGPGIFSNTWLITELYPE